MPSGRRFIVHNFTVFFQTDIPELKRSIDQFQVVKQKEWLRSVQLVVNENYDTEVGELYYSFLAAGIRCTSYY